MPAWAAEHAGAVPRVVSSFMPAEQAVLLATLALVAVPFAVAVLLPVPVGAGAPGERSPDRLPILFLATLAAALGTNALGHLGQAALTGGYVPGLATGLGLCVPYAGWALWALGRRGLLSRRAAGWCALASAVLQVPFLVGAVAAARWITG